MSGLSSKRDSRSKDLSAPGNALGLMQWYSPETKRAGGESQSMRPAAGCVKSTMARNAL
jgi:hypothetical protein